MKTPVKAIALLLMVVLCLNLMGFDALATNFECEMVLTAYNTSDNLMISVGTTNSAGAVAGKLTFDSNLLAFKPEKIVCSASSDQ